jgi:hypothetical protein
MSAVRSLAGYRAAETRRERDEFATQNIPSYLIPLWNRVKLNFRGSPEERAEQFLHYAHEHEGEGIEAISEEADKKLEAMIREHEASERWYGRRSSSGGFTTPAILVGLGLVALGYVVYRVMRKKTSSSSSPPSPFAHRASGPTPWTPAWPSVASGLGSWAGW